MKKHLFYHKPLDKKHLLEEMGDTLFYLVKLCAMMGSSLKEVESINRRKLYERHQHLFIPSDGIASKAPLPVDTTKSSDPDT